MIAKSFLSICLLGVCKVQFQDQFCVSLAEYFSFKNMDIFYIFQIIVVWIGSEDNQNKRSKERAQHQISWVFSFSSEFDDETDYGLRH